MFLAITASSQEIWNFKKIVYNWSTFFSMELILILESLYIFNYMLQKRYKNELIYTIAVW